MECSEKLEKIASIVSDDVAIGDLSIVVLPRGWIFVGALTHNDDGTYELTRCENVRRWSSGGFGGLTRGASSSGATLDKCESLSFDEQALILRGRLPRGWHNA